MQKIADAPFLEEKGASANMLQTPPFLSTKRERLVLCFSRSLFPKLGARDHPHQSLPFLNSVPQLFLSQ
jgi:hypothetical protein